MHGVCFTRMLSNEWIVDPLLPDQYLPSSVAYRLRRRRGDFSLDILQDFLDAIRRRSAPTHRRVYDSARSPTPAPTWRPASPPASSSS
ncbi:MAG: hypothetical protein R2690_11880 [Acidimicrobiales bacterium]